MRRDGKELGYLVGRVKHLASCYSGVTLKSWGQSSIGKCDSICGPKHSHVPGVMVAMMMVTLAEQAICLTLFLAYLGI
jgi:hypothetical protein